MKSEPVSQPPHTPAPRSGSSARARRRILVVDDDPQLRTLCKRILRQAGYEVHTTADALSALLELVDFNADVILSDVGMPVLDGFELLREVRARAYGAQVVLITGMPDFGGVNQAFEDGACQYLAKPFDRPRLLRAVQVAVEAADRGQLQRAAMSTLERATQKQHDAQVLGTRLDSALGTMWLAYQPIVLAKSSEIVAYEALLRSNEPTLPTPDTILEAAEELGRLHELGRKVRRIAASWLRGLGSKSASLFVNLHSADLLDEDLFDPRAPLSGMAERTVLEITERSSLGQVTELRARLIRLRGMGFRIAIDDLGMGYAGLTSILSIKPEIVKLDMSLVRDIDADPLKRRLVAALTAACKASGTLVVAEGIESPAEHAVLITLGCDLLQGYLFGRPSSSN